MGNSADGQYLTISNYSSFSSREAEVDNINYIERNAKIDVALQYVIPQITGQPDFPQNSRSTYAVTPYSDTSFETELHNLTEQIGILNEMIDYCFPNEV